MRRSRGTGRLVAFVIGIVVLVVVLVVGVVTILQAVDRQAAADEYAAAADRLEAAIAEHGVTFGEATDVLALAAEPFVPSEATDAVADESARAAATATQTGGLLGRPIEGLGPGDVRALATELRDAASELTLAQSSLASELEAFLLATRDYSWELDEVYTEAENQPRIAFREAAAALGWALDDGVDEALAAYLDAGHALVASHDEELAEKAGPLFPRRVAAQEFARSIAGGVMLEFDWAPLVNGYGYNGSYGGTSYWVSDHGGYATITLSDSVADMWPGPGVMALVAHEVGHAILSRPDCYNSYFGSAYDQNNEEAWATAWAIGMGYTADGSGESIYGRPSDGLIALTQQCR